MLTVGTELPAPPFWIGEDYDALTGGFEVDLAKEIAKRRNLASVKFVEMPFTGLVAGQLQALLGCWAGACPLCKRPAPRWLRHRGPAHAPT